MLNFYFIVKYDNLIILCRLYRTTQLLVPGGYAAWNRGADYVKYLVPSLRAGTRYLTGRRELFNQATLA